jgi:cyclic pyranopterin phosphate synthase
MLHVLTGPGCNNNCLFCMEADRDGRDAAVGGQSPNDIRAMIHAYPSTDEILFTSGEPTLNADLLQYVMWARNKGFRVIGLITNGRRLAYPSFLARLVEAGINRITVSIHGHEARLHDGLTRSPGSFQQTDLALKNLSEIKRLLPVRVHTSTVITNRNLPSLSDIHRYLSEGPSEQLVFNIMMARGRGAAHFQRLMPRYSTVVNQFRDLCDRLGQRQLEQVRVVDVPPCVQRDLPVQVQGELESFDQFERLGSTGLTEIAIRTSCSEVSVGSQRIAKDSEGATIPVVHLDDEWGDVHRPWWHPPWISKRLKRLSISSPVRAAGSVHTIQEPVDSLRGRISAVQQQAETGAYYMTRRDLKDGYLRAKGPPCRACVLALTCPGVWKMYVDFYGWSEFRSVDAP